MYLLIRYPGGIIVEGVVLAKGRNRLRVVAAGIPDAVELKRVGATWSTCRREVVEIDFLMSDQHESQALPASVVRSTAATWN